MHTSQTKISPRASLLTNYTVGIPTLQYLNTVCLVPKRRCGGGISGRWGAIGRRPDHPSARDTVTNPIPLPRASLGFLVKQPGDSSLQTALQVLKCYTLVSA